MGTIQRYLHTEEAGVVRPGAVSRSSTHPRSERLPRAGVPTGKIIAYSLRGSMRTFQTPPDWAGLARIRWPCCGRIANPPATQRNRYRFAALPGQVHFHLAEGRSQMRMKSAVWCARVPSAAKPFPEIRYQACWRPRTRRQAPSRSKTPVVCCSSAACGIGCPTVSIRPDSHFLDVRDI